MKKWLMILIIAAIFFILMYIGFFIYENSLCSFKNFNKCDTSCISDSDCKMAGCSAININEEYHSCSGLLVKECVMLDCVAGDIKCIDNNCAYLIE